MSDIGMVRLLIPDTDPGAQLFDDDDLQSFLDLEGGDVRYAAAQALDVAASSEVMVSKVIKTQDLSTDGTKVSADLRARAESLRDQTDGRLFEVIDFEPYPWRPELTGRP